MGKIKWHAPRGELVTLPIKHKAEIELSDNDIGKKRERGEKENRTQPLRMMGLMSFFAH